MNSFKLFVRPDNHIRTLLLWLMLSSPGPAGAVVGSSPILVGDRALISVVGLSLRAHRGGGHAYEHCHGPGGAGLVPQGPGGLRPVPGDHRSVRP